MPLSRLRRLNLRGQKRSGISEERFDNHQRTLVRFDRPDPAVTDRAVDEGFTSRNHRRDGFLVPFAGGSEVT